MIRQIGQAPTEPADDTVAPVICSITGRTWTGAATCHCVVCHCTFTGVTWFDRHQRGGRCLRPSEVRDRNGRPVFKLMSRGDPAWGGPDDSEEDG